MSGTKPVCEPFPLSKPNIDSVSAVNVRIVRAELVSCVVSDAHGPLVEGDPSVWTSTTHDSLIHHGLTTGESQACSNLSLGGSIRSGIAHPYDVDGLGDNAGNGSTFTKIHNPLTPLGEQSVLPPSHRQVRVMMATVSLFRKRALPLVQRSTRPSRG